MDLHSDALDTELEPVSTAAPPISCTLTVPSSTTPARTDLRVAMKLLRVVRSFESGARARGLQAKASATPIRRREEKDSGGFEDAKAFHSFAKDAKKRVERCLSWQPMRSTLIDPQGSRRLTCRRHSFRGRHRCCDRRRHCRQKRCNHDDACTSQLHGYVIALSSLRTPKH